MIMVTLAMALAAGTAATEATVRDISSFEKDFNAAKGTPRVVTILSPT